MSYRPKIKADSSGTLQDLPLDAETVQGKTPVFTTTDQSVAGVKTYTGNQIFTGYLDIRGTAAEKHLKTSGIGGSDGSGNESDLYLQYNSSYSTKFGKTGTGSLNSDGTITENGTLLSNKYAAKSDIIGKLDTSSFQDFINNPFGWVDNAGSYDEWTYFLRDELGFIDTPHPTYYLHTIRAYQSSAPISSVVFSVISTKSEAYTKSTLYSSFPNKVFHASGFCGSFVKADSRIQYVYLDSATTIKMYHGNNTGTSQAYGGSYFADEVKKIA